MGRRTAKTRSSCATWFHSLAASMIFLSAGPPSRFAEWCEVLLISLVRGASSRTAVFHGNSLEDIGREVLRRPEEHAVVIVRQAQTGLSRLLAAEALPFVLALETPEPCVASLMQDHGLSFLDAVRAVSNAYTSALSLMAARGALVLRSDSAADPAGVAQRVAAHFRMNLSPDAIAMAAQAPEVAERTRLLRQELQLPPYESDTDRALEVPHAKSLTAPASNAVNSAAAILRGAAGPLCQALSDEKLGEIVWAKELFYTGGPEAKPPLTWIDVSGPARCLLFGPYISLPEGSWSCSLMIGCSPEAAGLAMSAEIYAEASLARVAFELGESGFFELDFSFVLRDSNPPLQLRLFNTAAAFEGHIAVVQVRMTPLRARRLAVAS
jgi:hypothetical protein